jgi:phosphoglycerate dehydrogenase-like enzyme
VLYGCPPPELLRAALGLKWHHLPYAGAEPYNDLTLYANREVMLTNASGVYGGAVAEHILGMALAMLRQFPFYLRQQYLGEWEHHPEMGELYGAAVLICGTGDLGKAAAEKFRLFGCRVLGVRRLIMEKPPGFDEIFGLHELPKAVGMADIIISTFPNTRETAGVFNSAIFKKMRPSAIFINAGRGAAVVEADLIDALERNLIAGAALDVFESEPLAPDSPLRLMENVLLTPHCAGISPRNEERNYEMFCDLLTRYTAGRQLYNIVDFFAGY